MTALPDISVVLFQREKWWIAQCLEYDIGAQAFSISDALYELDRTLVGHICIALEHERVPFSDLPKAPDIYWKKWEGRTHRLEVERSPFRGPMPIPRPNKEVRIAD